MNGATTRATTISIWGAAVLLAVAGCTAAEPAATTAPSATAAPTVTATPEAAVTPEPAATPATAALVPCADLLTADEVASIEADGLSLATDVSAYDWEYSVVKEIADTGTLCRWTGQGDVSVVVGQLAVTDTEWPDRRTALLAEGFVADDSQYPGLLDGPDGDDESYPGRGVVHSDGVLYYVSYPGILPSIVPLAG